MAGVSVRIEFEPGWLEQIRAAEAGVLNDHYGPEILADMQQSTPVLTDRLRDSEDFQVVETAGPPELQVGSFPDDDGPVPYALATEFGFHGMELVTGHWNRNFMGTGRTVWIREHPRRGNTREQPYMRPAIYRAR